MQTSSYIYYSNFKRSMSLIFIACIFALLVISPTYAAEGDEATKSLKDTEFLGLKLIEANLNSVRSHLWDVGGFLQAPTTVKQRNIDKFFPWTTIRDSYYVLFQYNHAGNVVSVKRLYRPYSIRNNNKRSAIKTQDVARQMIAELGQPTSTQRKGWGGSLSYPSYTWQDESIEITIDREGSEALGNVFIEYTIKTNKRYEVITDKEENA